MNLLRFFNYPDIDDPEEDFDEDEFEGGDFDSDIDSQFNIDSEDGEFDQDIIDSVVWEVEGFDEDTLS